MVKFLDKQKAIVVAKEQVSVESIYTFSVPLPQKKNDCFSVSGEIVQCTPCDEGFELEINQLAGSTKEDEIIFNAYLTFKQSEQELEVIHLQNQNLSEKLQQAAQQAEKHFQMFSQQLSLLNGSLEQISQTLKQSKVTEAQRAVRGATLH